MAMGTERARATVRRLQADLTAGRWPLNTRIPTEHELADELGVGRSTVREAVRSLAHVGMLEPAPGRGTFVRSLSPVSTVLSDFAADHSPDDLLGVRQALEVHAARQAALQATPEQVQRLRRAHEADQESTSVAPCGDPIPGSFHSILMEIGSNSLATQLHGALTVAIHTGQDARSITSEQDASLRRGEHLLILEAIAQGNPAAAQAAAQVHTQHDLRLPG